MEWRSRNDWVRLVFLALLTWSLAACFEEAERPSAEVLSNGPAVGSTNAPSGNRKPTISGNPQAEIGPGMGYAFQPTAHDPDGDRLAFSILNLPRWASFNPTDGRLSGTPSADDLGVSKNIVISVSDGQQGAHLPSFSIRITESAIGEDPVAIGDDPVVPPQLPDLPEDFGTRSVTLSWVPPSENADGSPLTDLAGFKILYGPRQGNYVNVIDIPNPGLVSYVVEGLSAGTYHFVTTAYTLGGAESDFSNRVVTTLQ